LLAYPLYLIIITLLVFALTHQALSFLLLLIVPFTAWSQLQLKKQLD